MSLIRLSAVSKTFPPQAKDARPVTAVDSVDLEIAAGEIGDPGAILDDERPVGAHFLVERIDRHLVGKGTEHGAADITGKHACTGENEDAEQPKRQQRQKQALQNIGRNCRSPRPVTVRPLGGEPPRGA